MVHIDSQGRAPSTLVRCRSAIDVNIQPRLGRMGIAKVDRVVLATDAYVWSRDIDGATPYRPDRVTGAFRSLRDRAGLEHVTFHSFRHFAATTLAGQGVGVRTIA